MKTESSDFWFVGAMFGGARDQLQRFLDEGIWENGYTDRYLDVVRSMRVGDRIAIKASYVRKNGLPFDNRGRAVSVMAIKAVGVVTENLNDGRTVRVDWQKLETPREWYFYTNRTTIWRVKADDWMRQALIGFAFDGMPQPVARFLDHPYWKAIYEPPTEQFGWVEFYEALADRLVGFRSDRTGLVDGIFKSVSGTGYLRDQFSDGTSGPLRDICPFTVIGIFNRGLTDANRKRIAQELKDFLRLDTPVPDEFAGIPVLFNTKSWFFSYAKDRGPDDIDLLWNVFAMAIQFADTDSPEARDDFSAAYEVAQTVKGVAWNLTMGLYWIRPWVFPTLDEKTRSYLKNDLLVEVPESPVKVAPYLALAVDLESKFQDPTFPVHSFPELSQAAWLKDSSSTVELAAGGDTGESARTASPGVSAYTVDDIVADGSFVTKEELEDCIARLRYKKNLILQGPPGTGKTWLARRLAFALVGQRDSSSVRAVQFHPNLSYEDFVRGWRPSGDGRLSLVDGPFMEAAASANEWPERPMVMVIEEINRGNPAQILGEMLTLLEADKRDASEALEMCYRRTEDERVHLPDNLYLIGTMNVADRSLALVDFALRRRFAFIDLEPRIDDAWRNWVVSNNGLSESLAHRIQIRMNELNETIRLDTALGPAFRIGHSYVTPRPHETLADPRAWFLQVVETEIGPLLDEYWFDALSKSKDAKNRLRAGV